MTNLWFPGAIIHDIGNTGVMNGGPARATHHATSNTTDWTFKKQSTYFANGGRAEAPHLVADPFTGEVAQYFPANSRSLSLQNAGSIKTNRTGKYNIQIEWVFTQGETRNGKKYQNLEDTPMKPWPAIHAWLKSLGIPDVWPGGPPKAWVRDTVSIDTWLNKGGHYGHFQAPGNSHVDPGPMGNLFPAVSASTYAAFPGANWFILGRHSSLIERMHSRLVAVGCDRYTSDANKNILGTGDKLSYEAWQRKCGYKGADAKWPPGKTSWDKLKVPAA